MNRLIWSALMVCSFSATMAQQNSKGLEFFNGTWSSMVNAARQQKKMIFVDVYTTWCGPCKLMDRDIFPLPEVGNKYNPGFINYKVDAEKGEGKDIARRFNINAYPTFLYLNSEGNLIMKVVGEKKPAAFIALADTAVQQSARSTMGAMEADFKKGNRDLNFLKQYVTKLTQLDVDNSAQLDEYFKAVPIKDVTKEETLIFLGKNLFGTQSASFTYVMAHYASLSNPAKDQLQDHLVEQILHRAIPTAIAQKRFTELKQLWLFLAMLNPLTEKQSVYAERLKLAYAEQVRDLATIKELGYQWIARIKDIPIDSIRAEDARRYKKFITPYLEGKADSTSHDDWKEGNELMKIVYSKEIAYKYYYPASLFVALPDSETVALRDALQWALMAQRLDPGMKAFQPLVETLRLRQVATPAGK